MEFEKPKPVTYANPEHPGNLSDTNLLPWQRTITPETHEALGKAINSAENIQTNNEGLPGAEAAADSVMNSASPSMATALSRRAQQRYAIGKSANRQSLTANNVNRQRREVTRIASQMNKVELLKRHNAEGQIRFADQIAEYNDNLEVAKYQVLGNMLGGMGSFAGSYAGGGFGEKKAASQKPDTSSYYQSGWEDR